MCGEREREREKERERERERERRMVFVFWVYCCIELSNFYILNEMSTIIIQILNGGVCEIKITVEFFL